MRVHALGLLCAALLALAPASAAWAARPWYHTAHAGKPYVNPDLTPQRVIGREGLDPSWDGQLVLWPGRVRACERDGFRTRLLLDVGLAGALVPVEYRYKAINLESNRTGFLVAVKGSVKIRDGRFAGLDGKSIILLAPPAERDYETYLRAHPTQSRGLVSFVAWWISFHNPACPPAVRDAVSTAIVRYATENRIDPLFLASLIQIESAFRVDIVSPSGAIGLGQLMPFTARGLGVDPWNPRENVKAAARYVGDQVHAWERGAPKDPRAMALAGYNAGPTLVRSVNGIPAIPQTTNYVYFIGFVHESMTSAAARAGVVGSPAVRGAAPSPASR